MTTLANIRERQEVVSAFSLNYNSIDDDRVWAYYGGGAIGVAERFNGDDHYTLFAKTGDRDYVEIGNVNGNIYRAAEALLATLRNQWVRLPSIRI